MRLILTTLSLLLLLAELRGQRVGPGSIQQPSGPSGIVVLANGTAAAACTTVSDQTAGTTVSVTTDSAIYNASRFTASASYTSCKVDLYCFRTGTLTGNTTVELWSHNGGANTPASLIASSTANPTENTTPAAYVSFVNLSASLTSGTIYWIVVHATTGGTFGGTQFTQLHEGTLASGRLMNSPDGTTWSEVNTGVGLVAKVYQ